MWSPREACVGERELGENVAQLQILIRSEVAES